MKRVLGIVSILIFSLFIAGNAQQNKQTKAANFLLEDENGKIVELAKMKGKVVLVNFWATWCPPCRAEIPDFIKAYDKYKSKGFEIIGIALDREGWSVVKPFIAKQKMNYPVVMGNMKVVEDYGSPEAIPTSFFIDKKGNIVDRHVGMLTKEMLDQKINSLLR